MGSQANMEKMQLRQNYRNLWHTDLMRTIQNDPPWLTWMNLVFTSHICAFLEGKVQIYIAKTIRGSLTSATRRDIEIHDGTGPVLRAGDDRGSL
ncbi:PLAC8 family protein [Perilla frutescens var. hirtella]|nr:PLAC8 family protein [Perilla frutescens var. hirtella]